MTYLVVGGVFLAWVAHHYVAALRSAGVGGVDLLLGGALSMLPLGSLVAGLALAAPAVGLVGFGASVVLGGTVTRKHAVLHAASVDVRREALRKQRALHGERLTRLSPLEREVWVLRSGFDGPRLTERQVAVQLALPSRRERAAFGDALAKMQRPV